MPISVLPQDYAIFLLLTLMTINVVTDWDDYRQCREPLHLWLIVDYIAFILFRVNQFAFQYATQRLRRRAFCNIPQVLVLLNLWLIYPFIWLWSTIGFMWFSQSGRQCMSRAQIWQFISWQLFSFIYLSSFAYLIFESYCVQNPSRREIQEDLPGVLARLQRSHSYALRIPRDGLTCDEIDSIPLHEVKEHEIYDTQCAICLTTLNPGEYTRNIPCQHLFHSTCLDQWLLMKHTCPVCVGQITAACSASPLIPSRSISVAMVPVQQSPFSPAEMDSPF
jgi:E3 ubiquitin-protein ligase SIS3